MVNKHVAVESPMVLPCTDDLFHMCQKPKQLTLPGATSAFSNALSYNPDDRLINGGISYDEEVFF